MVRDGRDKQKKAQSRAWGWGEVAAIYGVDAVLCARLPVLSGMCAIVAALSPLGAMHNSDKAAEVMILAEADALAARKQAEIAAGAQQAIEYKLQQAVSHFLHALETVSTKHCC